MRSSIDSSIARDIIPITPSDATTFDYQGFKVKGNAGDVRVITKDGTTRTIPMASGEVEPVAITKILATGTTATGIWAYKIFKTPA
jgi:hypothetical protein